MSVSKQFCGIVVCAGLMLSISTGWSQGVDLSVTKVANTNLLDVGSNVIYTVTLSNLSSNTAAGVTLTDTLPAELSLVSITSALTCTNLSGTVICDVGTLDSTTTVSVAIEATATVEGSITNTVSASSNQADDNPTNNTATAVITVGPPPVVPGVDLSLTKVASVDSVDVGSNVVFTLTLFNHGTGAATGVTLTDVLPADLTFVSLTSSSSCTNVNGTITCDVGNLDTNATVTVDVEATATTAGSITNTATAASIETDDNPTNNTATAVITVGGVTPPPPTNGLSGTWVSLTSKCQGRVLGNGHANSHATSHTTTCVVMGRLEISNTGEKAIGNTFVQFYLSDDGVLDSGDQLLRQLPTGRMRAGKTRLRVLAVAIQGDVTGKFIIAVIGNNQAVSGPL